MGMTTLRRRIEALEKCRSASRITDEKQVWLAVKHLSREELDLMLSAALAERRGRALTESESTTRHSYTAALEAACRGRGRTVPRLPHVADLIQEAALRQVSDEDLRLCASGLRTQLEGRTPSAYEVTALRVHSAIIEAEYQRAGFRSQAEFESWYAVCSSASSR